MAEGRILVSEGRILVSEGRIEDTITLTPIGCGDRTFIQGKEQL
jgi:hypothetical protein